MRMSGVLWGVLKAALEDSGVINDTRIREIVIRENFSVGFVSTSRLVVEIGVDRADAPPIWIQIIED